jgi:hypothetical protein
MTATRLRRRGKRAFLVFFVVAGSALANDSPDLGWRVVLVPAFERPSLHENIPGSDTAILAVARPGELGLLEYATTRGAMRWARDLAEKKGETWLADADVEIRRGKGRVIDRILITGKNPLLSSLVVSPAFYHRFEPLLGEGFHVIMPDRNTIALYPRLAGRIPPGEAGALLRNHLIASHPVSREVFRATRGGLQADGILTEE